MLRSSVHHLNDSVASLYCAALSLNLVPYTCTHAFLFTPHTHTHTCMHSSATEHAKLHTRITTPTLTNTHTHAHTHTHTHTQHTQHTIHNTHNTASHSVIADPRVIKHARGDETDNHIDAAAVAGIGQGNPLVITPTTHESTESTTADMGQHHIQKVAKKPKKKKDAKKDKESGECERNSLPF